MLSLAHPCLVRPPLLPTSRCSVRGNVAHSREWWSESEWMLPSDSRNSSTENQARGSLGRYRGSSLVRKRAPLGPYSRPLPRVLWRSSGGGRFLLGEVPLYRGPGKRSSGAIESKKLQGTSSATSEHTLSRTSVGRYF